MCLPRIWNKSAWIFMKFISTSVLNMVDLNFKTLALDSQMHMLCFALFRSAMNYDIYCYSNWWFLCIFLDCRWWYKASYDCVKVCVLSVAPRRWLIYNWQLLYVHLLTLEEWEYAWVNYWRIAEKRSKYLCGDIF